MESFGLFANARYLGRRAACLLTISDIIGTEKKATVKERETAFTAMMEIALGAAMRRGQR